MAPTAIKNSDVPTVIRAGYLLTPSRSLTEQLGLCQNDRPAIHCQPDYTRYRSGEKSGRPERASSPRALTVVHLRSALSFRSSSASCALSTVESSLPLSLPLRATDVDGQGEYRRILRNPSPRSTMALERAITLAVRSSGLDPEPRRARGRLRAPTAA